MSRRLLLSLPLLWLAAGWGCLPSSGEAELYSDASPSTGAPDAASPSADGLRDRSITLTDFPLGDTAAQPGPEQGSPGGPQPPFGAAVGMTAANFVDIPDCDDTPVTLHDLYNLKRGVLIAMMSPS